MSKLLHTQRRSRFRKGPTISLFPFLAVLICTMGALVPLLLAMARQARLQALHEATAKAAQRQADAQAERELTEWRIGELKMARKEAEERLSQARLALGHVESHARRLRQQGQALQDTLRSMTSSHATGSEGFSALEGQLRRIQAEIAEAEKQLIAAQEAVAARPRSYAIIPYQGPNGTYRPPIYIECRADAIVLQPEGIALTEADFEEPLEADNPLDRALRAARETMLSQGQIRGDGSDEPYPLLIVRPDGIPAFYVARAALASWKSAVGYELIDKDWELEFPDANPAVGLAMRAAVAEGREQRRRRAVLTAMLANANSPGVSGKGLVGIPSRGAGAGAAWRSKSDPGVVGPPGQATGLDPARLRDESAHDSPSPGGAPPAGGSTKASISSVAASESLPPAAKSLTSQFGERNFPRGSGSDQHGKGSDVSGPASQPNQLAARQALAPDGAVAGSVFGSARTVARDSRVSYRAAPGGGLIQEIDPDSTASTAIPRRGGYRPRGATGGSAGNSGGDPRNGGKLPQVPAGHIQEAGSEAAAVAMRPGEWVPQETRRPETNRYSHDQAEPAERKTKRLADSRGENWGLPNAARGSVGVTRPIRVRCSSNRLEILPDDPKAQRCLIPLGERIEDTIDDFVSAVWEHMKSWGIAGRGMYWRPILRIEVTPDAEFRFEELKTLLDDSGLIVERKS